MYTAIINGVYENGKFRLNETPPTTKKYKVAVMFVEEENTNVSPKKKGVTLGSLAGMGYSIPDDFNEPLDDLKEYM
jgi:hypothetical protein